MSREKTSGGQGQVGVGKAEAEHIVFPPFRLDVANEQLWRSNLLIALRPKTFALLRYLVERPHRLITKEELLSELWSNVCVGDAVLKTSLREIRKALGDAAKSSRFIETAHGRGYRFIGRIQSGEPAVAGAPPADQGTPSVCTETAGPPSSSYIPERTTFVGRETDLSFLEASLRKVRTFVRQIVFVTGESGIGKTMLVDAFVKDLRSRDDTCLAWGQCIDQFGAREAYMPILEALRRLCRGPRGSRVLELLRQSAPRWLMQMPGLVPHEPPNSELSRADVTPERMLREMAETLETLSEECAVVLVLEDLHWADYSTLDFVSYLAQRSGPARVLVLATYRPLEVLATNHPLGPIEHHLRLHARCQQLILSYLDESEVGQYLAERLTEHRLSTAVIRLLHQRTAGNPLFMRLVVDAWLERGFIAKSEGAWQLEASPDELRQSVPESVVRMIELESDRLTAFEQAVLEAASVAGLEASTAAAASAIGEDPAVVEELCTRWARTGQFLRLEGTCEWPDGTRMSRYEFIHALYHQAIYERLGKARAAQLHRRVGEREETGYGSLAHEIAAELAVHFERGREPVRAIRYLRVLGEQALRRGAHREAIDHYGKGLELVKSIPEGQGRLTLEVELLVARGAPLAMMQGYSTSEVATGYARARALCWELGAPPELLPAMLMMGAFYLVSGEYQMASEFGRQLLVLAEQQARPAALLEANIVLGMCRIYLGELPEARAHLERALELSEGERDEARPFVYGHDPCVVARCNLIDALWLLGYPDQALTQAKQVVTFSEGLASSFTLVFAQTSQALLLQFRREHQLAREIAQAVIRQCAEQGFSWFEQTALMILGGALVEEGEHERGIALIRQGWEGYQQSGAQLAGTYWRALLVRAYAKAERTREALDLLEEAFVVARSRKERWWEAELYRLRGELIVSGGVPVLPPLSAEACFEKALALARHNNAKSLELRAATSLARLWRGGQQCSAGQKILLDTYAWFSEGLDTPDLKEARGLLDELATLASFPRHVSERSVR